MILTKEYVREHIEELIDEKGVCNVPEGITIIGDCAFAYCKSLTKIDIPNSIIHKGKNIFHGCTKLNIADGHNKKAPTGRKEDHEQ